MPLQETYQSNTDFNDRANIGRPADPGAIQVAYLHCAMNVKYADSSRDVYEKSEPKD